MEGYIQHYKRVSESFDEFMKDLDNKFSYHEAKGDQSVRYENIRKMAKDMAIMLDGLCPSSRELSLAMTNLEQVVFWANAAIARNEELIMLPLSDVA
ncbi:MAG: hypothetical protein WA061_02525 [Microgenomates group bacterium]